MPLEGFQEPSWEASLVACRNFSRGAQAAANRLPGGAEAAPRKFPRMLPGGSQEATGRFQEAPGDTPGGTLEVPRTTRLGLRGFA